MKFTAEEAFEAADAGEPIVLSRSAADHILRNHDADGDFWAETKSPDGPVDAAAVLMFLGY